MSTNQNQAVVGTLNGSIYYLSPDGTSELCTSTAKLNDLSEYGSYVCTAHSDGGVKLWQSSTEKNWNIVIQFYAKQAALCLFMVTGEDFTLMVQFLYLTPTLSGSEILNVVNLIFHHLNFT